MQQYYNSMQTEEMYKTGDHTVQIYQHEMH
jgi:hypothetical protein